MASRPSPFSILFLLSIALVVVVSAARKSERAATFPDATILFSKCLAPFKSVLNIQTFGKDEPVCSVEEFSTYNGAELMKMDGKDIGTLPPSYFELLRSEQAAMLKASFINQLGKEQALAFPRDAVAALPTNSRKLLNKIKKRPGPVARAVIMGLSAITAFVIFKYS